MPDAPHERPAPGGAAPAAAAAPVPDRPADRAADRAPARRPMLLRLAEDLHEDLAALAAAHDEPVSVVTRRALRAGLTVLHAQHALHAARLVDSSARPASSRRAA